MTHLDRQGERNRIEAALEVLRTGAFSERVEARSVIYDLLEERDRLQRMLDDCPFEHEDPDA